uniref:Uncharacterized protein n=1 Tax=Pseudictyota dubia TaxID=2749911 RepID=A0A7R9YZD1_9STRA
MRSLFARATISLSSRRRIPCTDSYPLFSFSNMFYASSSSASDLSRSVVAQGHDAAGLTPPPWANAHLRRLGIRANYWSLVKVLTRTPPVRTSRSASYASV